MRAVLYLLNINGMKIWTLSCHWPPLPPSRGRKDSQTETDRYDCHVFEALKFGVLVSLGVPRNVDYLRGIRLNSFKSSWRATCQREKLHLNDQSLSKVFFCQCCYMMVIMSKHRGSAWKLCSSKMEVWNKSGQFCLQFSCETSAFKTSGGLLRELISATFSLLYSL